jgi:hypothetical protein
MLFRDSKSTVSTLLVFDSDSESESDEERLVSATYTYNKLNIQFTYLFYSGSILGLTKTWDARIVHRHLYMPCRPPFKTNNNEGKNREGKF